MLADTRMKAVFTSGFRMAALSTTYKGDPTKTLCYDKTRQGAYEVSSGNCQPPTWGVASSWC